MNFSPPHISPNVIIITWPMTNPLSGFDTPDPSSTLLSRGDGREYRGRDAPCPVLERAMITWTGHPALTTAEVSNISAAHRVFSSAELISSRYEIIEPFTAVEATAPPAQAHARDR